VRVLLDTHALLWWVIADERLSKTASSAITAINTEVLVSAVSAWETTTKVRLGKLPGAELFAAEFSRTVKRLGFRQLAITVDHGQRAGFLPGHHKDPFDRILIAQSLAENIPLISNEKLFDDYGIQRIW
jgi:PIN domain nuclease of toxin-antitoxin system